MGFVCCNGCNLWVVSAAMVITYRLYGAALVVTFGLYGLKVIKKDIVISLSIRINLVIINFFESG